MPLLSSVVEDETQLRFRLKRSVAIEILAANAKWIRGLTTIGIALDETAYLPSSEDAVLMTIGIALDETAYLPSSEDAANSDISILEAARRIAWWCSRVPRR